MTASILFDSLSAKSNQQSMLPVLLAGMEKDEEYAFLQDNEEYATLIAEYKIKV